MTGTAGSANQWRGREMREQAAAWRRTREARSAAQARLGPGLLMGLGFPVHRLAWAAERHGRDRAAPHGRSGRSGRPNDTTT
jgi:hypothetical protein